MKKLKLVNHNLLLTSFTYIAGWLAVVVASTEKVLCTCARKDQLVNFLVLVLVLVLVLLLDSLAVFGP